LGCRFGRFQRGVEGDVGKLADFDRPIAEGKRRFGAIDVLAVERVRI
jgi:hypothetical protein